MGVTRRIIFPSLRLLVWALIAVALLKLAFAGASDIADTSDPLQPTAQIAEPQVTAQTGTITNAVTVAASVVADPAAPVRATMAGTVGKLLAKDGQAVDAGTAVVELRQETPVDPTVTTDPETGVQTVKENKPKVTTATVRAGVAGTLHLAVLKDQVMAVGDTVGSVDPGTMSVSGTLTPAQQYRLIGAPAEAQVTLKGGPAPFTCTGLHIGAAPGAATTQPDAAQTDTAATATSGVVSCAVPAGVTAFAGLGADIAIVNGTAQDAVLVPTSAVQGSVENGNVWVVGADGTAEMRAVTLGLTDGESVQVVDGLAVGDVVLQYIPVAEAPSDVDCNDPAQYDPAVCNA